MVSCVDHLDSLLFEKKTISIERMSSKVLSRVPEEGILCFFDFVLNYDNVQFIWGSFIQS